MMPVSPFEGFRVEGPYRSDRGLVRLLHSGRGAPVTERRPQAPDWSCGGAVVALKEPTDFDTRQSSVETCAVCHRDIASLSGSGVDVAQ